MQVAQNLFKDLEFHITTGHRFLGGFIGDEASKLQRFVDEQMQGVHSSNKNHIRQHLQH